MTTRVLVIGGGQNAEHEVSLASAAAVAAALRMGDHEVTSATIDREGVWRADGIPTGVSAAESLALALPLLARTDVVFPAVHGALGEDGALAALCALAGVRVVGSGLRAGAIGMDKWTTKLVAEAVGLGTARGRLVAAEDIGDVEFEGAVVVKPVSAGSSHGVSLVSEEGGLLAALREAARFDRRILVEEVVRAREIDVGGPAPGDPRDRALRHRHEVRRQRAVHGPGSARRGRGGGAQAGGDRGLRRPRL